MELKEVTVVRLYMTEGERRLESLLRFLHDQEHVRGVTVFRGITGFGKSGKYHASTLLDLSFDLPLVVEFFDTPERISQILADLESQFEPGHIIQWRAQVNA